MNETASAKYRKRPIVIEAHQWFKNGDHPEDYAKPKTIIENGEVREIPGEYAKERGWEGAVVRYFRHPEADGAGVCGHCGRVMHVHGWIDTLEGGHTVCPGDWIITGIAGERYPCKPDIFAATYEPAAKGESDRTDWLERRVTEMEQEIGAMIIGRDQSDKIAATANTEAVRYMREREDAKAALALTVKILTDSEHEWRTKLAAANASLTEAARLKAECERGTCAGAATMGAAVSDYRDKLNGIIAKLRTDNERLRAGIDDALMHLRTNYDIDGNSMNDSDAADSLRKAIGSERPEPGTFRAGDHVHHKPTGENWVVACDEEGGKIMPSGWPCCLADAADCSLLKAATDAERLETLQGHAKAGQAYEGERDPRTITARRQLAAAPEKGGQ